MRTEQSLVSREHTPRPPMEQWKRKKGFFSVLGGRGTLLPTDRTSGIQDGKNPSCDVRPHREVLCHRDPRMQNAPFLCSKQVLVQMECMASAGCHCSQLMPDCRFSPPASNFPGVSCIINLEEFCAPKA